jgi:hypothetical protein
MIRVILVIGGLVFAAGQFRNHADELAGANRLCDMHLVAGRQRLSSI